MGGKWGEVARDRKATEDESRGQSADAPENPLGFNKMSHFSSSQTLSFQFFVVKDLPAKSVCEGLALNSSKRASASSPTALS